MVSLELEARLDNLLSTAQEETADIDLFAPIALREECPICLIPLPFSGNEVTFSICCGINICNGCACKELLNNFKKGVMDIHEQKCAFCRQPYPENGIKATKKLMKKKNPQAFMRMAHRYEEGQDVFQSDTKVLEMRISAAELGEANAYGYIGQCYRDGIVVEQDMSKALAFYEVSAKKGSYAFHNTTCPVSW